MKCSPFKEIIVYQISYVAPSTKVTFFCWEKLVFRYSLAGRCVTTITGKRKKEKKTHLCFYLAQFGDLNGEIFSI